MASRRVEERRACHKRYKEDVERTGKSFFPHAMFHDTVMSLVVVVRHRRARLRLVLHRRGLRGPGLLGPHYTEKADPGTTDFVPRPDWYFYFLFYLLRIFKWPNTVVLGTVGVPNILLGIAIALPFIDLRRERRLTRRPVAIITAIIVVLAMGTLTYKGATAKEALASETKQAVPTWAKAQGFEGNEEVTAGRQSVRRLGLPPMSHLPRHRRSACSARPISRRSARPARARPTSSEYVTNPAAFGNTIMQPYAGLGDENLTKLAAFLDASKGPKDG